MGFRGFKVGLIFILGVGFLLLGWGGVAFSEESEKEPKTLSPEEAEKALRAMITRHPPPSARSRNPQAIIVGPPREVGSLLREMPVVDLFDAHEKKGDEYRRAGEYQLAISEYKICLQIAEEYGFPGPDYGITHWNLAETYEAMGDYPNAIHHVQILLEHWPSDFTRPEGELWKEALEAAALGNFDESVRIYQKLLERVDSDWERRDIQMRMDAMRARAKGHAPAPPLYLASREEGSKAEPAAEPVVILMTPKGAEALTPQQIAKIQYQATTPAQRAALVEAWEPSTEAQRWLKEGLLLEARGEFQAAAECYKKVSLAADADEKINGLVHFALQRCYEGLGDIEKERLELLWLKENVFRSGARYSLLQDTLTDENRRHLEERIGQMIGEEP
jgi:tetratricopeptide (TPR) repeat protein